MTTLTTRDTLVQALFLASWQGDPAEAERVWSALSDDLYPKRTYIERADRLFASGAVIDAATLADDDDLVSLIYEFWCDDLDTIQGVLRALAAALTERGAQ